MSGLTIVWSRHAVGEQNAWVPGGRIAAAVQLPNWARLTQLQVIWADDATEVNHAGLQLGPLHIFEALHDHVPTGLLAAPKRSGTLSTLRLWPVRLLAPRWLDPRRKLTEDERRAIVLQVDHILGLSSDGDGPEPGKDHLRESPINPSPDSIGSSSSSAPNEPPGFATAA